MSVDVESARRDWEDAHRRLEQAVREPGQRDALLRQLDVVSGELRRRVGARFTLRELAEEYQRADSWVRDVVSDRAASPGWPRTLSLVEGAAFYAYSHSAEDYEP